MSMKAVVPPPLPAAAREVSTPATVAIASVGLGIAVDTLALRRPPGVGASLAMVLGLVAVVMARPPDQPFPVAFAGFVPAVLVVAATPAVRASQVLVAISISVYAMSIAIMLRLYDGRPLRTWTLSDYVWRGSGAAAGIALEGARFVLHDVSRIGWSGLGRYRPHVIGVLAVLPLLALFAVLFASADAVFAARAADVLSIDAEFARLLGRFVSSALVALAAAGTWRAMRTGFTADLAGPAKSPVAAASVASALAALVVLFGAFVAVQITYLFGGRDAMALTGLTRAQYARRGFFEMVTVAALVLIVVTAADWLAHRAGGRSRVVDALSAALVGLTLVIVASAALRMRLYTAAFGLTELRFYSSVFMAWTAMVLILHPVTILRGSRAGLAFGMLVSGLVLVIGVTAANPDAVVAGVNIDRHLRGAELDYDYTGGLGVDAIPVLANSVDDVGDSCVLARRVRASYEADERTSWGWRSATWAHKRAAASMAKLPSC